MPSVSEQEIIELLEAAAAALRAGNWPAYAAMRAHHEQASLLHPAQREWLTGW